MKVTALDIKRAPSYDSEHPNELRGIVTLTGPTGQQSLTLTPCAIARIFEVIAAEVVATAQSNANQAFSALQDAQAEQRLLTLEV